MVHVTAPSLRAQARCRCLGPEKDRPSAQELLQDSFFMRRLGKGDSAKSLASSTVPPGGSASLTPRNSRRSETEGSDNAIHCQARVAAPWTFLAAP